MLKTVAETAAQIRGLKADPAGQIFVAAITGPTAPYQVHWRNPGTTDTGPWPEITHVCTAANGGFADPGVRTNQLVAQFGDKGFASSICDADYGPALERLAAQIGAALAGRCISEPIADDPARAGYQPQCTAEVFYSNGQGGTTSQSLPSCADNGGTAPCWSLSTDAAGCQRPTITLAAAPPTPTVARYQCAICASGVVGQGCNDDGATAGSVARAPIFGAPCDVGVSLGDGPGAVSVISPAPECASRVCLLPTADSLPIGTGALCTTSCTTNADCAGGLLRVANDPNDPHCKGGFVCATPTTVGDFCCQRMCACRDYVAEPAGGFQTPPACVPGAATACASVR